MGGSKQFVLLWSFMFVSLLSHELLMIVVYHGPDPLAQQGCYETSSTNIALGERL